MTEREQLEEAISVLESQRALLGDGVVETALAPLRDKLRALNAPPIKDQRKQVTVLFADVVGFTALAEGLDPEELRDLLDGLWGRLDALIEGFGGIIDKHLGDGVMALFGAPTAREDDPERAIRAALAIQQTFDGAEQRLRLRIGINTGPVLVGTVGTTAEYTVMGDTVNLAHRLMEAAPVSGIVIAQDSYRHVRGIFTVEPLPPLPVKGKQEPVVAFLVQQAKPRAFRIATRGVEGVETITVGRADELARLQGALLAAHAEKCPHLVTVVAEAGMGKSRLLWEFSKWIELQPLLFRLFQGRASPEMVRLPFSLMRDLLSFRFQIWESDPPALAREKLEAGFVAFLGDEGYEEAAFVGQLVGFDFSHSPAIRARLGDVRQLRERAFAAMVRLAQAATDEGGLLFFLEDIHWADEGSLDLIEHLLAHSRAVPLLAVALARPTLWERRPTWGQVGAASLLHLQPLGRRDSLFLVRDILRRVPTLPPTLEELVVSGAEGNPFYLEELVKMLVEDGVVEKGDEQWQVHMERLATVRVPPTLTSLLQARLDALPPAERELLQRASVVGRIFWDRAVARLGEGSSGAAPIEAILDAVRGRELIFDRTLSAFEGSREFIFKHALLREVTYESVLLRVRRLYHAQVAAWIIEQSGERANVYAGVIGEHWERAGDVVQAADWYARAARQARDSYTPVLASDYCARALALLAESPDGARQATQRLTLYDVQGEVLLWQAHYQEAMACYQAMRPLADAVGDPALRAVAWTGLARTQESMGDYRAALASAEQAVTLAREAGADGQPALARALFHEGWICYRLGEVARARDCAETALALSRALAALQSMAASLKLLGAIEGMLGNTALAAAHEEQALALLREAGDQRGVGALLNNLGATRWSQGDYQRAAQLYEESLAIARSTGDREAELIRLSNLGGALAGLGRFDEAEAALRRVLEMADEHGWTGLLSLTFVFLTETAVGTGREAEARSHAQSALRLAQEQEQVEFAGMAWRLLGTLAARSGQPVDVAGQPYPSDACFSESVRLFEGLGAEVDRARSLWHWAQALHARGDGERAAALWQEARALFVHHNLPLELARMGESAGGPDGPAGTGTS